MKRVYQDDTTKELGNCLQACIASRLNLTLVQVPPFKAMNEANPMAPCREWLEERGYQIIEVNELFTGTMNTLCLAAVGGKAKHGGHIGTPHVVVARIDRMGKVRLVHDPNKKSVRKIDKKIKWVRLYFIFQGSSYQHR